MSLRKFSIADALFERSPGQEGDAAVANMVDQRHGGPITIGYGRYGPDESMEETIAVHDVMIVLEGQITVRFASEVVTAGPGEIIYMRPGDAVTIRSHKEGAVTAYVTHPHWQQPNEQVDEK